jgi:hypothetical protein
MPKYVTLIPHLSSDELARRHRSAHEPHERNWWQILWLLARGQSARQVAQVPAIRPIGSANWPSAITPKVRMACATGHA